MIEEDELDLLKEKNELGDNYRDSLKELRKLSSFFKTFIKMHKEMVKIYDKKENEIENKKDKKSEIKEREKEKDDNQKKSDSLLFSNINNIYNSFDTLINNTKNLDLSLENDLVKPLDDFISNQLNNYNKNLNKIKKIKNDYKYNKIVLDNSRINYYKSSYESNPTDLNNNDNIKEKKEIDEQKDNLIKKKMIARNDEFIYKYESTKYNQIALALNEEYKSLVSNILDLEKNKSSFIQSLLVKYKNYLLDYVKIINEYISQVGKNNSEEIIKEVFKYQPKINEKFKNDTKNINNLRIPKTKFVSYQNYSERPDSKKIEEIKTAIINPYLKNEEIDLNNFIAELINDLISEKEINHEKIAKIIEFLNIPEYEAGKKFLNYLCEKRGISSLIFSNLQNLEHLSNILGYITLHQSSIFNGEFELNFKIIYIAERIFYRKKSTNDKIYLSALLSKNKYYRTKQFWRNVVELKLANKIVDHIKRIKNIKGQKTGIFIKIFKDNSKYFFKKSRILPLLKDYNSLDTQQLELINKITIKEMQSIIRENIPSFANFNFPSEQSHELITQLTEEYRIDNQNINFYVTYYNVSSYTIRKLILNEKDNTIDIYNKFKTLSGIDKKLKLFTDIIPYLSYGDYNNLLLCSKLFHKKLSKKIYQYILKKKNLAKNIRLSIWQNLLGISELKKNYNYKEILANANEEKVKQEIELDIIRTKIKEVDNPEEIRKQLINILYAVSQVNGDTKYCQGMNFVVHFLHEIFGEEESFYIFLAFLKNTEYNLIFAKDLEELKLLFYVFERVISLLEPELSSYFNINGVDFNYFLSPWFITLFTGSHQKFKGENDNSQILLRILDNFILSGLKSIMEVGCALLHSYENILMSKRYEEMMQFLINDMMKSDFFSKKNQDFIESFFTKKISKNLVKNIEEEYHLEKKLNQTKDNN